MKNVYVHFIGGDGEPEARGYKFADIPRVGEFISLTDSNSNLLFEVAAVVHLAVGENYDFDESNLSESIAEIWVKNPVDPNEVIEKISK